MSAPAKYDIYHYRTLTGKDLYEDWLETLDRGHADRVDAYVTRMESGNFGNSRFVGDGVLELKVQIGPGYRVYYVRDGECIIVLLLGGDKCTQSKDILRARSISEDYWRRK